MTSQEYYEADEVLQLSSNDCMSAIRLIFNAWKVFKIWEFYVQLAV